MNIREYTDADLPRIQQLHSLVHLNYPLPPMDAFFSKKVVGAADIGVAVLMRLNAEVYLLCDPSWRTPAWRMEAIRQLHHVCSEDARAAGAKEAISFIPPPLEQKFGPRLITLGWLRQDPDWHCYYKEL